MYAKKPSPSVFSPERARSPSLIHLINSHDENICPMPQYTLSDLVEIEFLHVARNDRPV